MKPYWAVVQARFRMLLQYRAAALAGLVTQLFWGLLRVMFFDAFYRSSSAPQPMTYPETVTYLWLIQALLLILPWSLDTEVRNMIRSGTVAYELARPTDLYWFWFSRSLAMRTAPVILRATPMFLIAGLFFGLQPPASPLTALAALVALLGAVLLGCAITTLTTISLLWTIAGDGTARLLGTASMIFSGSVVPLPFFPDWAQTALNLLPFRGLMDTPFRLYIGHLPPQQALPAIAHQLAWTCALVLLGRAILGRGLRRLAVQGG
ncbi:MAG: ABC-2 type transporter [Chloroflexi bacterium]|jgi:ABC-2 type transport system permease protein|nr:ABC-2 type transporter [Chloroflexota bacterium]